MGRAVVNGLIGYIKKGGEDEEYYFDLFDAIRNMEGEDYEFAHKKSLEARKYVVKLMQKREKVGGLFELYRKMLLFDARSDFDSYLQYLEIDREPRERFYLPRRKVLRPLVAGLQDLADNRLDELFLSEPPRVGKLLADSTPVLTTCGWKTHGELKVGDYVFSPSGEAVPVIGVLPKHHTTHTIKFSDGSEVKCHFRHEWRVWDRSRNAEVMLETQEMIDHLHLHGKDKVRNHRYRFLIENRPPIKGIDQDLPIAPYSLGAWLGDGTNQAPRITGDKNDIAIIRRMNYDGYEVTSTQTHSKTGAVFYNFDKLRADLQKEGMCYSRRRTEKHIPNEYFTASLSQRLDLLAGLLDTDGSLRKNEHRYDFTTSEERLKDDFCKLIGTFGWRASVKEVSPRTSTSGIVGKRTYWAISFNPTMHIPCALERKKLYEFSKQRRKSIVSIEPSEEETGNCITVLGGMYCVGEQMIPTHNTTMLIFYTTWLIGRNSDSSNLYSAYSDYITRAFYNGVLEIIGDDKTYLWHDVFPNSKVVQTNAQEETINIDRRKHYPSLTCRSLYGTLNGACDCNGILISDDLIGGIEEALNPERMINAWSKVDNNLLPRAKEGAKILWCGTRWSNIDPAGLRMELLQTDEKFKNRRFRIINLPALNEKDESNFEYLYGVGFSTDYYHQRRASFERNNDMASWLAQYQGEPIERQGTLFTTDGFRFFIDEPLEAPDRVIMAVDPAFGGGDFTASPICAVYGDDVYVLDVVYDNGDKSITQNLLCDAIEKYGVSAMQIEANKATESYATEVRDKLRERGIRINLTTKPAPTTKSKEARIFDKAPEIREHFVFRQQRSKPYDLFMQNLYSFKVTGKNKHDDAPDSLSMACDMVFGRGSKVELFKRPF